MKKKFGAQVLDKGDKISCNFLKFGALVFLEIAYNYSLQQCISSRVKTQKKVLGTNLGKKGPKLDLTPGLRPFSQIWFISFLEVAYNDSLQQCLTCSRDKIHKKKNLGPNLGLKLDFLPFSQVWLISFP